MYFKKKADLDLKIFLTFDIISVKMYSLLYLEMKYSFVLILWLLIESKVIFSEL